MMSALGWRRSSRAGGQRLFKPRASCEMQGKAEGFGCRGGTNSVQAYAATGVP